MWDFEKSSQKMNPFSAQKNQISRFIYQELDLLEATTHNKISHGNARLSAAALILVSHKVKADIDAFIVECVSLLHHPLHALFELWGVESGSHLVRVESRKIRVPRW